MSDDGKIEEAIGLLPGYENAEYKKCNAERNSPLLVLDYSYGSSKLRLIGAHHIGGNPEEAARVVSLIKTKFTDYLALAPNDRLVMVEGFSGEPICMDTADASFAHGESLGMTFLSKREGIDVVCPEPSLEDQMNELLKMGFGKNEIMLYFIIRTLSWDIDYKRVNEHTFLNMQRVVGVFNGGAQLDTNRIVNEIVPELNRAMVEIKGKDLFKREGNLLYANFARDELAPLTVPTMPDTDKARSTTINEVARSVTDIRDKRILREIDRVIQSGKSLLIIYGRSHIARFKHSLDFLYGEPIYVEN